MALYVHESRVAAPLDEVWAFFSGVEGLAELTPGFLALRVESATGPGGEADPAVLEPGAEVTASVRPLGAGPRLRWTSRIVDRERSADTARFVDEMVEGPLERWIHTHRFRRDGDGTVVRDEVDWALPGGTVGEGLAALGVVGLGPVFGYRHRRTRALLEGGGTHAGER